ncbi:MAG: 3-coathanger stack domain-containing protein, partial [Bacteroidota bacterium]
LKIEFAGNFSGQVNLSINNLPAGLNANFSNNPITQSGVYTITLTGTNSVALGDYNIDIVGSEVGGSFTSQTTALLSIQEVLNNAPNLLNPTNGAINQARKPVLTWSTLAGSSSYDIEIAMDANFNNIVDSESSLFMTSFETTLLAPSTIHYWRVRGKNDCGGVAPWSNTFSFTTSAAASSTGTCSQPLDGICGMTYIGDLEDGEDNIDNYDPSGDPNSTFYRGPEQIYEVILTELSNVTFLLTDFDADLDLQLLTNCNDPINDWVTASNRIGVTEFERIDIRLSAGTYYIIVDGWQGAISEYILSIECEPVCESNGIVEDFESGQPSGWTFNVSGSGPNSTKRWMFDDGGFGIMSQIDNPGIGNWAYYDDFGNGDNGRNNVATARTPTVDLTGQSNIRIGFDYAFVETPIVDGETVRLSITDGPNTRYWNGVAWTNTVSNWLDDFTPFTNNGFLDIAIPNGLNISNLSVTFRYDDGRDRNNSGEGFGFDNFSLCGEIPNVCEDDLMVTGNPIEIDAGTYSANNTITSTGTVAAGTNVEFVAGQSITLEENFHAVANSTFTARIGACTSTARKEVMEERTEKFSNTTVLEDAISVYPNPMSFQNTIAIELSDAKEVSIELRNLTGQYVQSILPATTIEAGKHQFEWNARNLNSRIYFLVVRLDDKIRTQKLSLIK